MTRSGYDSFEGEAPTVVGGSPDLPFAAWQAPRALFGKGGFAYLATPYSRHPEGIGVAAYEAEIVMGAFVRAGVPVFCPIAHTHHVALSAGIDPWDHATWMPADAPLMAAASSLVVVMLAGWDDSVGVAAEVEAFRKAGKPVAYLDPVAGEWLAREKARKRLPVDLMAGVPASPVKAA